MKRVGTATAATGKKMGNAALHPSQTLRGAGQAVKTATVGGAVGYVGWEKLTTDKSVVRIVSDAVIGELATNTLAETADGVRELTGKAGEAIVLPAGYVLYKRLGQRCGDRYRQQAERRVELSAPSLWWRCHGYVRQLFPQPRQRQRVGVGHRRTGRGGVPHIRTLRLVRKNRGGVPRHDAYR